MSKDWKLIEAYDVREWLHYIEGEFTYHDLARCMLRMDYDNNASALSLQMCLDGMCDQTGELERVGGRWGHYRKPKKDLVPIDITEADDTPVDIFLPFGMHQLVHIFPGNIITVGGEKNAGKTGYFLNLAFDNRDRFKVHYFNSEMGPGEIRLRCVKHSESNRVPFSEWKKVNFYERSDNFSDVIFPGKGSLNIIDFYECHDEFYKMGEGIRKIHDRLNGALAFIAIQKNPGNSDPVGGRRVTEKSRVHLSISYDHSRAYPHKLKIEVGKNWADPRVNPRGMCVDYKLAGGSYLKSAPNPANPTKVWYEERR